MLSVALACQGDQQEQLNVAGDETSRPLLAGIATGTQRVGWSWLQVVGEVCLMFCSVLTWQRFVCCYRFHGTWDQCDFFRDSLEPSLHGLWYI